MYFESCIHVVVAFYDFRRPSVPEANRLGVFAVTESPMLDGPVVHVTQSEPHFYQVNGIDFALKFLFCRFFQSVGLYCMILHLVNKIVFAGFMQTYTECRKHPLEPLIAFSFVHVFVYGLCVCF